MNFACFLSFLVLFWSYPGYLLYLELKSRPGNRKAGAGPPVSLSIIVPTYNESALISEKIRNLEQSVTGFPAEFFFTDASSDDTPALIERGIRGWTRPARLVKAEKGRRNQLNAALPLCSGDAVVITDADTLFQNDTLKKIADSFSDPDVAVVGARVEPVAGYPVDQAYWKAHNSVRVLESALGHCSAVSGGCYAFRRSFLGRIPEGVWSDDIYVPFKAHVSGLRCLYLDDAPVLESRAPRNAGEFVLTKARKAGDYMIELLRLLPRIAAARGIWRTMYITKLVQVFAAPAAVCLMLICLLMFGLSSGKALMYLVVLLALCAFGVLMRKKETGISGIKAGDGFAAFVLANVSLLVALFLLARHGGKSWYHKS